MQLDYQQQRTVEAGSRSNPPRWTEDALGKRLLDRVALFSRISSVFFALSPCGPVAFRPLPRPGFSAHQAAALPNPSSASASSQLRTPQATLLVPSSSCCCTSLAPEHPLFLSYTYASYARPRPSTASFSRGARRHLQLDMVLMQTTFFYNDGTEFLKVEGDETLDGWCGSSSECCCCCSRRRGRCMLPKPKKNFVPLELFACSLERESRVDSWRPRCMQQGCEKRRLGLAL